MKRLFPPFLLALLVSSALAQTQTAPTRPARGRGAAAPAIKVVADHPDWNYLPGQNVQFTVTAAPGTAISYTLGRELRPPNAKTAAVPDSGTLVIDGGTLDEPGFLRCVVTGPGGARGLATAGFAPEKIKFTQTEPADFDAFWTKAKAELAALPMDPKLTPLPQSTTDKVEAFEINLQNIGTPPATTSRFYGILYVPRGNGPYPAIMAPPGAGVRGPDRSYGGWTDREFIVLNVGIHEMPVIPAATVTGAAPVPQVIVNYPALGLDNPDHYYFRRVLMGCLRANDYLVSLPKWDRKNLVVMGGSQGGYLTIATTGLDPRVTACAPSYPGYCDVTGLFQGRAETWPALFTPNQTAAERAQVITTTSYFDAVNFARRIKVPGHYAWGYNDDTCPPASTFAAYNVVTAPKTLAIFKEMGHARVPAVTTAEHDWVLKQVAQPPQ